MTEFPMKPLARAFLPALLFTVSCLTITGAGAQDFSDEAIQKASPYKDLPGVQDPEKIKPPEDEAECSQELVLRNFGRRHGLTPDETAILYRCEKNGIVIESARPPRGQNWNPLEAQ